MSEESAQIYNKARRSGVSSYEAWADLSEIADAVDWDVERMLSAPEDDEPAVRTDR